MAASSKLGVSSEYAVAPTPGHDGKHRTQSNPGAVKQDLERFRRRCSVLDGLHQRVGFVGLHRRISKYACFALRATLASPRPDRYTFVGTALGSV